MKTIQTMAKRDSSKAELNDEDDSWIGPLPTEAVKTKKKKGGVYNQCI
jgi:hypothetical protein